MTILTLYIESTIILSLSQCTFRLDTYKRTCPSRKDESASSLISNFASYFVGIHIMPFAKLLLHQSQMRCGRIKQKRVYR